MPASLALELGLAFFHEGATALDVILAVEAGFDHRLEPGEIPLRLRLADLARGGLGERDRQRGVLGDRGGGLGDGGIELIVGDDTLHEAHIEGLLGRELPPGE